MVTRRIPKGFDAAEFVAFEKMLEARRKALLGDVEALEAEESMTEGAGSGLSIHSADMGTDRAAHDVSLGCLESATGEVQEIEEALRRIREGTFGICEACGNRISRERLKAIPYARLCMPCKTSEETA